MSNRAESNTLSLGRGGQRAWSMRGNRERDAHNRRVALEYIKANPLRLAAYLQQQRKKSR